MYRKSLTSYDEYPYEMMVYLRNNGPHFNRKLCEYAVSFMEVKNDNGEKTPLKPYSKEDVDRILDAHGIHVKNNILYDATYVANMCKADFLKSSVTDERHLAMYVKDALDDIDAPDGLVFNRWYADMCYMGIPVDWESVL